MSLAPEERQRIYEEEKARLEAQERAKAELEAEKARTKRQRKKRKVLWIFAVIAAHDLWTHCGTEAGYAAKLAGHCSGH